MAVAIKTVLMLSLLLFNGMLSAQPAFKQQQLKYKRVKAAFIEKESYLKTVFTNKKLTYPPDNIFIRIFKREKQVEVWAADRLEKYQLVLSYDICSSSGELGPKRTRGDMQVPEGFYIINDFNPASNFHLSLGVSYPNRSDLILKTGRDPGGSIYIHGNCVTIGCIPITDDKIKELYLLAVESRANGQKNIPVHIYPAKLDSTNFNILRNEFSKNQRLIKFWENLKAEYNYFESNGRLPKVTVDSNGKYHFE